MKLSELFKISPLAWEQAKREVIKQHCVKDWERFVEEDADIDDCFMFYSADNSRMWITLAYGGDTMLLKEWEEKQNAS